MISEFSLKPDHIKLLSVMCHIWNKGGNILYSKLQDDHEITKVLGITSFDHNGNCSKEDSERINTLIDELPWAIEALIKNALEKL